MAARGVRRQWPSLTCKPVHFFLAPLAALAQTLHASSFPQSVKTDAGELSGVAETPFEVTAFKEIPFAAPPTAGLRWKPPTVAASWHGVLKADHAASRRLRVRGGIRHRRLWWRQAFPVRSGSRLCHRKDRGRHHRRRVSAEEFTLVHLGPRLLHCTLDLFQADLHALIIVAARLRAANANGTDNRISDPPRSRACKGLEIGIHPDPGLQFRVITRLRGQLDGRHFECYRCPGLANGRITVPALAAIGHVDELWRPNRIDYRNAQRELLATLSDRKRCRQCQTQRRRGNLFPDLGCSSRHCPWLHCRGRKSIQGTSAVTR